MAGRHRAAPQFEGRAVEPFRPSPDLCDLRVEAMVAPPILTFCYVLRDLQFVSILAACLFLKKGGAVSKDLSALNKSEYFGAQTEDLQRLKEYRKYKLTSMKRFSSSFLQIVSWSSEIKVVLMSPVAPFWLFFLSWSSSTC